MFGKNRNKKVGICVMVVTSCFILAGLWAVLATPETALAHKDPDDPGHSHGGGGGGSGGGGEKVSVHYWLSLQDTLELFSKSDCPRIGRIDDGENNKNPRIIWNRIQGFGGVGDPRLTVGNLPGMSDDPDLTTCFPDSFDGTASTHGGTMLISADGTEVTMTFGARAKSGGPLQYHLTMTVVAHTLEPEPWEPLGLVGGESATLFLGNWVLKPGSGPAKKGCVGSGDFAGALTITVTRFTMDEEIAGKDDPSSLVPPDPCP